jgi:hypothetical protein
MNGAHSSQSCERRDGEWDLRQGLRRLPARNDVVSGQATGNESFIGVGLR